MTLERFQSIVLKLGNQDFLRHWYWLNYPHEPQQMALQFHYQRSTGAARKSSCECGACKKCIHRVYVAKKRAVNPESLLRSELEKAGFRWNEEFRMWVIERSQ